MMGAQGLGRGVGESSLFGLDHVRIPGTRLQLRAHGRGVKAVLNLFLKLILIHVDKLLALRLENAHGPNLLV